MVHPHFLYCLPIYSFTGANNINLLSKKQKQCIRVINKAKFNAHTEPLFYISDILPFNDLIVQQKLLLMHPVIYGYSSVKFHSFRKNTEVQEHIYPLRNNNDFFIPRSMSAKVTKMPLIDFPSTWNAADDTLKSTIIKKLFKKNFKLQCMDNYSNFRCNRAICISCIYL